MENLTVDVERIEQELQEIRSRFSKADIVLRELEEIQIEFENLAKTHKQLKNYVSEVTRFNKESNDIIKLIQQAQTNFEQRFEKLREVNEVKTEQIHDESCKIQHELNVHHSLIDELHQSLAEKQNLFHQFRLDLTEIKNQLNSSTTITKNIDNEMSKIIADITDVSGKLKKVNQDIDSHKKQMEIMRYAIIALGILWLCLVALVLRK
jgi:chromosome segregation ATPase